MDQGLGAFNKLYHRILIGADPAGNIKADKEKSTEKIDCVVALIMALDRAIRNEGAPSESVYDQRGLLVF